jgi:hypothetical protein
VVYLGADALQHNNELTQASLSSNAKALRRTSLRPGSYSPTMQSIWPAASISVSSNR